MSPTDGPFGRFHRAVDTDRPACGPMLSWRTTIGLTILVIILSSMAA